MDKINPYLLATIIGFGIGFIWIFWSLVRPEKPPQCICGSNGRLMGRQENGQRAILTYHCSANCGNVWEVAEPSFEARRANTAN